ncbi:MAG TPA: thioredoxin [Chitinophagales bacterium]|nr:thioredoxin [Chitinophagales bacterium]HNM32860.1 thioredoxin [Chitinophagales bacterium]
MQTSHKKSFAELIQSDKPVLVDFYADWCGPCKVMHPLLEELKKKMNDNITILKINVDKNSRVSAQYRIQSIPTLILFKNGQAKWRQSGVVPVKQLEQIIAQYQ